MEVIPVFCFTLWAYDGGYIYVPRVVTGNRIVAIYRTLPVHDI